MRLYTDIEPHRAVKGSLLVEKEMSEFIGKCLGIDFLGKVSIFPAPGSNCLDYPSDQLADAPFPLRGAKRPPEIF